MKDEQEIATRVVVHCIRFIVPPSAFSLAGSLSPGLGLRRAPRAVFPDACRRPGPCRACRRRGRRRLRRPLGSTRRRSARALRRSRLMPATSVTLSVARPSPAARPRGWRSCATDRSVAASRRRRRRALRRRRLARRRSRAASASSLSAVTPPRAARPAAAFSGRAASLASAATRCGTSAGGTRNSAAVSASAASCSRTCSSAAVPVSAVIRRVPADTLSSPTILNRPTWPVLSRCVPPHSSLLNSPIETIRTMSGYFSPKSIIAPALAGLGERQAASSRPVRAASDALVDVGLDRGQLSRRRPATGLAKSNRSQSSSTFEPCCWACLPRCLCSA